MPAGNLPGFLTTRNGSRPAERGSPCSGSRVRASTSMKSAFSAKPAQRFVPVNSQSSPSRTALVSTPARSEPAPGSHNAMEPIHWPRADLFKRWRRRAASRSACQVLDRAPECCRPTARPAQALPRRGSIRRPRGPSPPLSAGMVMPNQPLAAIGSISERGISPFLRSSSSAIGSTTSRAKARASPCSAPRHRCARGRTIQAGWAACGQTSVWSSFPGSAE